MNDHVGYQQFLDNLKRALGEPEIQAELKKLLVPAAAPMESSPASAPPPEDSEIDQLKGELEGWRNRYSALEKKFADYQRQYISECTQLKQENSALQEELQWERKKHKDELQQERKKYEENLAQQAASVSSLQEKIKRLTEGSLPFRPLLDCLENYRALSDEALSKLDKILPCDSPVSFWAMGSQIDNVFRLWDAASRKIDVLKDQEVRILTDTVEFFLQQYNSLWESPVFALAADEAGKPFNDLRHLRGTGCSLYQGNIQKVLLPGIWNLRLNKMERRCIVMFD